MQTFEEFLSGYVDALPEFFVHPVLAELAATSRNPVVITHERFRLTGRVQFASREMEHVPNRRAKDKGMAYYLHVPDRELVKESPQRFTGLLTGIPATNYYWHSLYLNLFAFLNGAQVSRLLIVHMYDGCKLHQVNYRPDLIKNLLEAHTPVQPTFTPAADVMAQLKKNAHIQSSIL